jgi:hypothetical protein
MMLAGWIHHEEEVAVATGRRRFESSGRCSAENGCASQTDNAAGWP